MSVPAPSLTPNDWGQRIRGGGAAGAAAAGLAAERFGMGMWRELFFFYYFAATSSHTRARIVCLRAGIIGTPCIFFLFLLASIEVGLRA
jgi:hypothetical protein